jgi:M6 family metalloprotease-like protein
VMKHNPALVCILVLLVVVAGQQVTSATITSDSTSAPLQSSTTPVLGAQKLAVITVQFPDDSHNTSVFDPQRTFSIFDNYYRLNSYGKMWWEISISPTWYTLPQTQSYYGPNPDLPGHGTEFVSDSLSAASRDLDLAQFTKAMIVYAKRGRGSLMGWTWPLATYSVGTATYQLAVSVVSEGYDGVDATSTIEHEARHLLGLPDLYQCVDNNCFAIDWDGMGGGTGPCTCQQSPCVVPTCEATMFSSWSKLKLGWIDGSHVKTIQAGEAETVTIDPLGLPPTGISVIKVPVTQENYYLIEVREAVGADANLPPPSGIDRLDWRGVFVLSVNETAAGGTRLGTLIVRWINPQTQQPARNIAETSSAAFQVGESFSDRSFGVMTVNSKSGTSYQIEVNRVSVATTIMVTTSSTSSVTSSSSVTTSTCIATACGQASAGVFSDFTAVGLGSIPIPPPAGAGTFPDGLFSFTISGVSPGQTVTATITLSSPLPAGAFSYWKFQGNAWTRFSSASLDSTRRIITLTLTVPAGSTSISDPGGPAVLTATTTTTATTSTLITTHSSSTTTTTTLPPPPLLYNIAVTTFPLAFGNPQGGGAYPLGLVITISVNNVPGYIFAKWQRDGVDYTSQQCFTYTVDASHTFTAIFQASIVVIVTSVPTGLDLVVDGASIATPCTFTWVSGSSHTLSANSPVNGVGLEYVWTSWSDGGAQSHTVTPSASTIYTANYAVQAQTTASTYTTTTHTTIPPTTQGTLASTSASSKGCIIATAAYGSEIAPDVVYMRFVRDQVIGSTHMGRGLVNAFNTFYYAWSPAVAQAIAGNELLRALFRILLLPIVGIVHIAALVFTSVADAVGSRDAASVVAFMVAASLSVIIYVSLPVLATTKLVQAIRGR